MFGNFGSLRRQSSLSKLWTICRAHTGTQDHTQTSTHFHFVFTSLALPATPCPQQLPHVSHQTPPHTHMHTHIHTEATAELCFQGGYSVTEKSPLEGLRLYYRYLLLGSIRPILENFLSRM